MELFQLRYFVELARQGNFTHAAQRLNVAQPALSQQIQKLEGELGALLFVRGRRQTRLTAAGEALMPRAEGLLANADAARQAVAEVAGLERGRLTVSTIPSFSGYWLPRHVRRFRESHPAIELALIEESSEGATSLVETGTAEIGFVQFPVPERRFVAHTLLREPFVLVVPPGSPWTGRRSVKLSALARESFVLYKGRARDTVLKACHGEGFEPRIACESGQPETVRALVAAGLGIAILPRMAMPDTATEVVAVSISKPPVRELGWICARGQPLSPAAKAFVECFAG